MNQLKFKLSEKMGGIFDELDLLEYEVIEEKSNLLEEANTYKENDLFNAFKKCEQLERMRKTISELKYLFENEDLSTLNSMKKDIIELSYFVEFDFPAYKDLMLKIKNVYPNISDFVEKCENRNFHFDIVRLLNDGLYKLDAICIVSKELRSEKEILKNILADNTIDTIPNLREKENKLKDLSFIFNFLISMP